MTDKKDSSSRSKTTSYKVVLPFYAYATCAFLIATTLLFFSSENFLNHYFQPHIIAITHIMTLGWATMIILGASYQFLPVMIESELYSDVLAYCTFILSAIGIPLLAYGFYFFDMGFYTKLGGSLIVLSLLTYLMNLGFSITKSPKENIHAIYIFTAALWLVLTASIGLTLVFNFTDLILPNNSLHYLPLHVNFGIIGWFILLVIGVASRLIPMFLISKYTNPTLLKTIYYLINASILSYFFVFEYSLQQEWVLIPLFILFTGILLFSYFCYKSYTSRIRKAVDAQMKLSLFSIFIISIPILLISTIIITYRYISEDQNAFFLSYGFIIIFGWITALILGMTFKTLPFIIWTKEYFSRSHLPSTPNPKDLFNSLLFKIMSVLYLIGLILFISGIFSKEILLLKTGSVFLLFCALLYTLNVIIILKHTAPPLVKEANGNI
jgi:hypothetical protein